MTQYYLIDDHVSMVYIDVYSIYKEKYIFIIKWIVICIQIKGLGIFSNKLKISVSLKVSV